MDLGPTGAGRSERQRGGTSHPSTERRTPQSATKLFIVREIVRLVRNGGFLCAVLEKPRLKPGFHCCFTLLLSSQGKLSTNKLRPAHIPEVLLL